MKDCIRVSMRSKVMMLELVACLLALPITLMIGCGVDPADEAADPAAQVAPSSPPRHCVSSSSGVANCYGSFTDAIAAATGGQITDAPADPKDVDEVSFAARINDMALRETARNGQAAVPGPITNTTDVVIGIVYKDAHYRGDTWVFTRPYGCDGSTHWEVFNLNASPYTCCDFNDNISSFHSYSSCNTIMWSDWNEQGIQTNGGVAIADMEYVGDDMNDKATTIQWH